VPSAEIEDAAHHYLQKLLAAPEFVGRSWAAAKRESQDEITEREVTVLLADIATVWNELFPAEQARIVQVVGRTGRRAGGYAGAADQGRGPGDWGRRAGCFF
jgi:hypothetical protein